MDGSLTLPSYLNEHEYEIGRKLVVIFISMAQLG